MNLSVLPDRRATENPFGPAVADDNTDLNNAQFLDAVQRAAATLRRHGVSAGDVVAIMLPNTRRASWCRCSRRGGWVRRSHRSTRRYRPAEVNYQIADAGGQGADRRSRPSLTRGRRGRHDAASSTSGTPGADLLDLPNDPDGALALLIYTSGTTGRPKGVMLDHANLNAMCRGVIDAFKLTPADHSLLILPLFHVNGIVVGDAVAAAGRRPRDRGRAFQAGHVLRPVEQSRATYFSAVPTIYTMLCGLPDDVKPDTSSVRFAICGAAPASVELLEQFESRYGIPLIEGYGLSEGSCASTVNPLDGKRKPGTVGLPLPGQTIRHRRRRRPPGTRRRGR